MTTNGFILALPFPPSVNGTFRQFKGSRLSEKYREWRDAAGWIIKSQKPVPVDGEVSVSMYVCPPDRRVRDMDNLWKACLDLLVKHGLIEDDNMSIVIEQHGYVVREGDPCTLIVRPVA